MRLRINFQEEGGVKGYTLVGIPRPCRSIPSHKGLARLNQTIPLTCAHMAAVHTLDPVPGWIALAVNMMHRTALPYWRLDTLPARQSMCQPPNGAIPLVRSFEPYTGIPLEVTRLPTRLGEPRRNNPPTLRAKLRRAKSKETTSKTKVEDQREERAQRSTHASAAPFRTNRVMLTEIQTERDCRCDVRTELGLHHN